MDAAYAETIVFRFIGYNLLGSAVRDVTGMLSGLSTASLKASDDIGRNISKAGQVVAGVGSGMILFGILAAAGLGYAASKAADFTSEIILLHTQARVATSQLSDLSQGVLSMSGAVGFAPTDLAKALYYIESVGGGSYTTAHALDELKAAAMGAAVGHADLANTASILASVMAVFPGMLPVQAMGQLDAIIGQGKMTMEDLNGALKTGILATLQSSGVSLADFGGALATMTDYAIPATQAANAMRMAIYLMDAPTAASNKVLKEFGLTTAEVSSVSQAWTDKLEAAGIRHAQLADDLRKPGGIIIALQDLRKHLLAAGLDANGQAEVIYKAFGGGKMGKAVITLYENIGGGASASDAKLRALGFTTAEIATLHDRLVQKTALINAQTNLLGQNFAYIKSNDPVQMWNMLKSSIDALVISLGQVFLPVVISIMQWLTPLITRFTDWIGHNQTLVRTIGIFAVAILMIGGAALFLVGVLGMIAGSLLSLGALGVGSTILPLIGIFLAIGAGLAAAAIYIITHWAQVQEFLRNAWTALAPIAMVVVGALRAIWDQLVQAFDKIKAQVLPALIEAWKRLQPQMAQLSADFQKLWSVIGPVLGVIAALVAIVLGALISGAFVALVAFLSTAIPTAIQLAVDVFQVLVDVVHLVTDVVSGVADIVTKLFAGDFSGAFESFKVLLGKIGLDILQIVGDLVVGVIHFFTGIGTTVLATVSGFVSGVIGFFAWLYAQLTGKQGDLGKWFQDRWNDIVKTVGDAFSSIGTFFHNGITKIFVFFQNVWKLIEAVWKEFSSRPLYWIGFMIGWVIGKWIYFNQFIFNTVKEWGIRTLLHIGAVVVGIINWFKWVAKEAPGWIEKFRDGVIAWIVMMAAEIYSRISDAVHGIIDWFKWVVKEAPGWIVRLDAAILQKFKEIIQGIKTWAHDFAHAITDKIAELVSDSKTWGKSLLDGFLKGIKDNWGNFVKSVKDLFSGFVNGLKAGLGISSPSKIFADQIGKPVIQGVWMGMASEFPVVQRNFSTFMAKLPQSSLPSSSVNPRNQEPTVFNSNSNIVLKLNEEVIAKVVDKRVNKTVRDMYRT